MANWKPVIDIVEEWDRLEALPSDDRYDEEIFYPTRDALVAKLRTYKNDYRCVGYIFETLLDELAEVQDVDDFDSVRSRLYDWADNKRVWIKTF